MESSHAPPSGGRAICRAIVVICDTHRIAAASGIRPRSGTACRWSRSKKQTRSLLPDFGKVKAANNLIPFFPKLNGTLPEPRNGAE